MAATAIPRATDLIPDISLPPPLPTGLRIRVYLLLDFQVIQQFKI